MITWQRWQRNSPGGRYPSWSLPVGSRRRWRLNDLRGLYSRHLSASRGLHRPHPERRQACRPAGRAADQIRVRDQSQDCQGARPRRAGDAARQRRRGDRMRRREFITLIGGAAAWPLAARAQQATRPRRIAVLMGTVETAPDERGLRAVLDRLKGLGWTEGATARIDVRWSRSDLALMRENAQALLALS